MDSSATTLVIIDSLVVNRQLHAVDLALTQDMNVVFIATRASDYANVNLNQYASRPDFRMVVAADEKPQRLVQQLREKIGQSSLISIVSVIDGPSQRLVKKVVAAFNLAQQQHAIVSVIIYAEQDYQFALTYEAYGNALAIKQYLEKPLQIDAPDLFNHHHDQDHQPIQQRAFTSANSKVGSILL